MDTGNGKRLAARKPALRALDIARRASGPALVTDESGHLLGWNEFAAELFGLEERPRSTNRTLVEVLEVRDTFGNLVGSQPIDFWKMISHGEPVRSFEFLARKPDGESVQVAASVVVVLGAEEPHYEVVYFLRPVLRRRRADEVIERILERPGALTEALRGPDGSSQPDLTPRQTEVLRCLSSGNSVDEIAGLLGVSVHTVRSHIRSILEKLGVHSQVEAVAQAFRDRLI